MMDKPEFSRPSTFFIITFILSWMMWIPLDLSRFGLIPAFHVSQSLGQWLRMVGLVVPAVLAILLSIIKGGEARLRLLFSRFKQWDVGWQWWTAALLLQPGMLVLASLVNNFLPGGVRVVAAPTVSASSVIETSLILLISFSGMVIGWHGFALPRLQLNHTPLVASSTLAVLWVLWQIPLWLLQAAFDRFGWVFLLISILTGLPTSLVISWFFNHSRQSLILPFGSHLVFNLINLFLLPVDLSMRASLLFIGMNWIAALVVISHLAPVGFKPYIAKV
jgi:hypothetical protein